MEVTGPVSLTDSTVTITGPGAVTITATQPGDNNYLPADPVSRSFCVKPLPEISIDNNSTGSVILQSNYASGNQWFLDEQVITDATGQQYVITQSGSYAVEVSVDNCSAISEAMPVLITSLEQPGKDNNLVVYPNPSKDEIFIILPVSVVNPGFEIFNINGQGIEDSGWRIQDNSLVIGIKELQPGMYFILIESGNRVYKARFVKE